MSAATYDVLGIGNAIFDVLVRTDDSDSQAALLQAKAQVAQAEAAIANAEAQIGAQALQGIARELRAEADRADGHGGSGGD